MRVQIDPLYQLFEKDKVLSIIKTVLTEQKARYESKDLLEILDRYYEGGQQAVDEWVQARQTARISKAAQGWKAARLAEETSGRTVVIRGNILESHINELSYASFPKKLHDLIDYYRDISLYELRYLVLWMKDSGKTETEMLKGVEAALQTDSDMNLEGIVHIVQEGEEPGYSKAYALAKSATEAIGIEKVGKRDIAYASEWINLGFTQRDIRSATARAIGAQSLSYIDRMLASAKEIKDRTGLGTIEEAFQLTEQYKTVTGFAGQKSLSANNVCGYYVLKKTYSEEMLQLAASTVQSEVSKRTYENMPVIYMERILTRWSLNGLTDPDSVKAYLKKKAEEDQLISDIHSILGISKQPTEANRRYLRNWEKAGYKRKMILNAAKLADDAKDPYKYISKVLQNQEK